MKTFYMEVEVGVQKQSFNFEYETPEELESILKSIALYIDKLN